VEQNCVACFLEHWRIRTFHCENNSRQSNLCSD